MEDYVTFPCFMTNKKNVVLKMSEKLFSTDNIYLNRYMSKRKPILPAMLEVYFY